ncbi:MAG: HNH endonuclease [Enterococcus sp.]
MAKYCAHGGCRRLIDKGAYCVDHQRRKSKQKRYYSKNKRFYKSQSWIDLAAAVRERDRFRCTICGKPCFGKNAQVDHILPIWLKPELRLDEQNCRLVCSKCHPKVEYQPKDNIEKIKRLSFDPDKYF